MQDIADAVEQLALAVEHQPSTVRLWAVFALASRIGLEAILSSSPDRVEAMTETGELWVLSLAELLEEEPDRLAEALEAAHAVIERLLDVVPDTDGAQRHRITEPEAPAS